MVERKLPNGMIETYVVEERGFRKGMHSIRVQKRNALYSRSLSDESPQSWGYEVKAKLTDSELVVELQRHGAVRCRASSAQGGGNQ